MKTLALFRILLFSIPALTNDLQENVSVEMVQIYVSATDTDDHFVTDLRREDLIVTEDGEVQNILDFTNFSEKSSGNLEEAPPLSLAFSMDISASMSGLNKGNDKKIDLAKKAAMSLIEELQPRDQMTVFGFHQLPKIIVPLTSDTELIREKLALQDAESEETALFDSLYIIVKQFESQSGRKIIVLASDGMDTASHIKFEKLLESLKASDVTLFAFGMDSMDPKAEDSQYVLEKLAEATGGYAFFPKTDKDLFEIMNTIRRIIRSQYSVWYTPRKRPNTKNWRKIDITCLRGGVSLRYRKGYYTKPGNPPASSE